MSVCGDVRVQQPLALAKREAEDPRRVNAVRIARFKYRLEAYPRLGAPLESRPSTALYRFWSCSPPGLGVHFAPRQ